MFFFSFLFFFLYYSMQVCHALEYQTRGQATSSLWHEHHYGRLTASRFGSVLKRVSSPEPLVERLLSKRHASSAALKWGTDHEDTARDAYLAYIHESSGDVRLSSSGLVLMRNGCIGCSPDGIVFDPQEASPRGICEVKCPYSARDLLSPQETTGLKNFFCTFAEGKLTLRRNHDYYYQCQGGMGVTGAQWCDFIVWTPQWTSVERIRFTEDVWTNKWLPALMSFFKANVLPVLVKQHVGSFGSILQPQQQQQQEHQQQPMQTNT